MKKNMAALLLLLGIVCSCFAKPNISCGDEIILLQTDEEMNQYCPDVNGLVAYIKQIQKTVNNFSFDENVSGNGFIFVAVRPFGKSNAWFDFSDGFKIENEDELKKQITAIPPMETQGSAVVFVVSVSVNSDAPDRNFVLPKEWKDALKNFETETTSIEELVDYVWPPYITDDEKNELLSLIEKFKNETDFSEKKLNKYSFITDYAVKTDFISISISEKYWPSEVASSKYSAMFLLAYISGNLEYQLTHGTSEGAAEAGFEFEVLKYKQLKEKNKKIKFKCFEN